MNNDPDNGNGHGSPINPFDAAMARGSTSVNVEFSAADVQRVRPEWSWKQCQTFLRQNRLEFAAAVLRLGTAILGAMTADAAGHGDTENN